MDHSNWIACEVSRDWEVHIPLEKYPEILEELSSSDEVVRGNDIFSITKCWGEYELNRLCRKIIDANVSDEFRLEFLKIYIYGSMIFKKWIRLYKPVIDFLIYNPLGNEVLDYIKYMVDTHPNESTNAQMNAMLSHMFNDATEDQNIYLLMRWNIQDVFIL